MVRERGLVHIMLTRQNLPKGQIARSAKQGLLALPQAVLDPRFKPFSTYQL
jgi:hypothetical protein